MQAVVVSAILIFISTSIDDLVLLIIFQSQAKTQAQRLSILVGQVLGIGTLVGISLVGSYLASKMLEPWVIGLFGIIPILLGIKAMVHKDETEDETARTGRQNLYMTVMLVTIASGGDNLGIYIPWFTTLDRNALLVMLLVFFALILLFWALAYLVANQSSIQNLLSRFSSILVPVVFLLLGFSILSENGTFTKLLSLIPA